MILEVKSKLDLKTEIYERTSSVPRKYHYITIKKTSKTKGKPVPLEYHYSTSIFQLDPYSRTNKNQDYLFISKVLPLTKLTTRL